MAVLSELSEGSSSSSSTNGYRYDVFLSFRGLGTRPIFTDRLHKALVDANITTFLDVEEIGTGQDLKPVLESVIKASRASVIVLSKNYATSTLCLDELVLILEQRIAFNHFVIPIFYHVDPKHVRKQQSTFGDAMAEHKQKMEAETDANKRSERAQKIDGWKKALTDITYLKGKVIIGGSRPETELIDELVEDILLRFHISSRICLPQPQLIGMDYSIQFVSSWLKDASPHTAEILTILGMGGIGKTSLVKYVYGLYSKEFDASSFIQDISLRCENSNGLLDLKEQLYDDISKPTPIQVQDVTRNTTSEIENVVACKKVLLVLDDIDSLDQLDALLGSKDFHPGSKIIITTRDASLTQSCALFKANIKPKHAKHMLQGLNKNNSFRLFCFHAFISTSPMVGYEAVSEKLVKYCEGHPLALEVLGRFLHNQDVAYWEEYIELLKKEMDSPINSVLRKSFDSLTSENDKELFKHIACFFVGRDRDFTETILKACDIDTQSGITNLIDRGLLSIGLKNELEMHHFLQQMGRSVVCQESPHKPWKRSRLWCHEESIEILKHEEGTTKILGLSLDMYMLESEKSHKTFELKIDALKKMDKLMLLQLNHVQMSGSYENFPQELRWLCMHGFWLKSIPSDLPMENLVALDMSYSKIESFDICYRNPRQTQKRQKLVGSSSKNKRLLGSLKILNLSFCQHLRSLGGFASMPALERLIVTNCIGLVEVCESIEACVELVLIDLSYCIKLEKLPTTIGMLKKVKTLLLDGCKLGESQVVIMEMDSPEMFEANNITMNTKLSSSDIPEGIPSERKFFMISLPRSLVRLSLNDNNLSTESFPMDLSFLSMLKELYLDGNPIVSMPDCVRSLPRLERLSMSNCKMLTSVEHPPHTLRELILHFDSKPLLRKVVFHPEMSPLKFSVDLKLLMHSSFEIEGMVKTQPLAGIEEKVLRSLGWTNLDFLTKRHVGTYYQGRGSKESEIQMYYQFGIFSIIYVEKKMPNWNWITYRSEQPSISFTIPSSPNNVRGLNFCFMQQAFPSLQNLFHLPVITIKNITKNHTWLYKHCIRAVIGDHFTLLSHWMFGKSEMEGGDKIIITVTEPFNQVTKECGVSFVYDDGEEDVLCYYKSWNHIIGGDLTGFQLTTGQYILYTYRFMTTIKAIELSRQLIRCCIEDGASFKEEEVSFRALSERKSNILDQAHEIDRECDQDPIVEKPSGPIVWKVYERKRIKRGPMGEHV